MNIFCEVGFYCTCIWNRIESAVTNFVCMLRSELEKFIVGSRGGTCPSTGDGDASVFTGAIM